MALRIASINANRGTLSASRREALLAWIERVNPAVLLVQEPWPAGRDPVGALGPLMFIAGDSSISAYALEPAASRVVRFETRWLTLESGGVAIHGVYFPADKSDAGARAEFLDRLTAAAVAARQTPHVMLGDFNLAPTEEDGLYGGLPSGWTSRRERKALEDLLAIGGLVDITRDPGDASRFTLERTIREKLSQFRCDLALVDNRLVASAAATVTVDHNVRSGPGRFTDHSALLVDLEPFWSPRRLTKQRMRETQTTTEHRPPRMAAKVCATMLRPENTAIRRGGPSVPTLELARAYLREGMRVLDFGCGHGDDVAWLRAQGFDATGYDCGSRFSADVRQRPGGQFDAVLMVYVVNVLAPAQRVDALRDAWSFVRPGGVLFVVSRPLSVTQEAAENGWPTYEDGHLSSERRGMFQKGHDAAALAALCAGLPGASIQDPALGSASSFWAVLVRKDFERELAGC